MSVKYYKGKKIMIKQNVEEQGTTSRRKQSRYIYKKWSEGKFLKVKEDLEKDIAKVGVLKRGEQENFENSRNWH